MAEAGDVAARQGADLDEDYTQFGPTNVTLHWMDVLLRFEDGWSALEAAEDARPEALAGMTRERQAGHRLAIARASLLARRHGAAAAALLQADELTPEEVRGRPETVNLVKDVVRVTRDPGPALRTLAEHCGLRA